MTKQIFGAKRAIDSLAFIDTGERERASNAPSVTVTNEGRTEWGKIEDSEEREREGCWVFEQRQMIFE